MRVLFFDRYMGFIYPIWLLHCILSYDDYIYVYVAQIIRHLSLSPFIIKRRVGTFFFDRLMHVVRARGRFGGCSSRFENDLYIGGGPRRGPPFSFFTISTSSVDTKIAMIAP